MKKSQLKQLIREIIKEVKLSKLNEAWVGFNPSFPVLVVGVEPISGKITKNGFGAKKFPNFAAAKAMYPDLDPHNVGERFTWAMNGGDNTTRFETWEAEKVFGT